MPSDIHFADDNFERVYIVGVKLCPGSHDADLFALVIYNEVSRDDENRPLTVDGRIAFFRNLAATNDILAKGDAAFRKYKPVKVNVAYHYDFPYMIRVLKHEDRDDRGTFADFANELLDFVRATNHPIPASHQESLRDLADAMTFEKDLNESALAQRARYLDALCWAVGVVVAHSSILD